VLIRGAAREVLADVATAALKRREPEGAASFVERQRDRIAGTPLIIAVGGIIRPGHKIPEVEQLLSVGAAAMNVLNAVHAAGFAGIWLTGANCYDPSVIQALGFGHPDRLLGFLFVGTPVEAPRVPVPPDPAGHVVEWTGPVHVLSGQAPLAQEA
jgi:nitroreductase